MSARTTRYYYYYLTVYWH
uniref:Uncharacterized protein n=1 Tax=Rhizophora mucronata TaxID=61149 RepID=A0A2P2N8Z2_RHIMU